MHLERFGVNQVCLALLTFCGTVVWVESLWMVSRQWPSMLVRVAQGQWKLQLVDGPEGSSSHESHKRHVEILRIAHQESGSDAPDAKGGTLSRM